MTRTYKFKRQNIVEYELESKTTGTGTGEGKSTDNGQGREPEGVWTRV